MTYSGVRDAVVYDSAPGGYRTPLALLDIVLYHVHRWMRVEDEIRGVWRGRCDREGGGGFKRIKVDRVVKPEVCVQVIPKQAEQQSDMLGILGCSKCSGIEKLLLIEAIHIVRKRCP